MTTFMVISMSGCPAQSDDKEVYGICEHEGGVGIITKPADCGNIGERTFSCMLCEETRTEESRVSMAHTMDVGNVLKQPTPALDGEIVYTCTVCDHSYPEPQKYT